MPEAGTPIVKRVCYYVSSSDDRKYDSYVDYFILDGTCVFTSAVRGSKSTINGEEEIILAICKNENILPNQLKFFDLQTNKGYPTAFKAGDFDYDEITFNFDGEYIQSVSWESTECPKIVEDVFCKYIKSQT